MKFLKVFLLALAVLTGLYLVVVGAVNPRRELYGHWIPELIPNSRADKLQLFEEYARERRVEGVILGSSRAMKLEPAILEQLTGKRYFNASVFAALPEDFLGMYGALRRRQPTLGSVLLALDVNSLRVDQLNADYLSNLELRGYVEGTTPGPATKALQVVRTYKNALSVSYARDALRSTALTFRRAEPINAFDSDGHLRYVRWEKQVKAGTYDRQRAVDSCAAVHVETLSRYDSLVAKRQAVLEQLLASMHRDGVKATILITPTHPALLAAMEHSPRIRANVNRARQWYADLARRHAVKIFDSTEDGAQLMRLDGWYDCTHYDDGNAARLLAQVVNHGL